MIWTLAFITMECTARSEPSPGLSNHFISYLLICILPSLHYCFVRLYWFICLRRPTSHFVFGVRLGQINSKDETTFGLNLTLLWWCWECVHRLNGNRKIASSAFIGPIKLLLSLYIYFGYHESVQPDLEAAGFFTHCFNSKLPPLMPPYSCVPTMRYR